MVATVPMHLAFNEFGFKMTVEHPALFQDSHAESYTFLVVNAANYGESSQSLRYRYHCYSPRNARKIPGKSQGPGPPYLSYSRIILECGSENNRRHIDVAALPSPWSRTD